MSSTSTATRLADRAVLRLSGPGARDFLQGLVTQDVTEVAPARPLWSGLLTPQGKVLFDVVLWDDGDAMLIDCEGAQADALARRLATYRLRRPIEIAPVEAAVHWSLDAGEMPVDPRLAALGRRWLGGPDGETASGWREHRLRLGVTEGVAELGQDATLWLECNARELGGVSFTKGCYVGQENTARMHHRSKVGRRLAVVALGEPGERTRARYPEIGLMVEHRRIEALADAMMPDWLARALTTQTGATDPSPR